MIAAFISFFFVPIINSLLITVIQLTIPKEKMGQILSLLGGFASAAKPIGILISGPLANEIGVSNTLLYSSILGIIVVILVYTISPLRNMNQKTFLSSKEEEINSLEIDYEESQNFA